jgi:hypothetical protein
VAAAIDSAHGGSSLADFSTLKIKAIRSSETSVHTRSTRRHIPEDGILHLPTLFYMYSFKAHWITEKWIKPWSTFTLSQDRKRLISCRCSDWHSCFVFGRSRVQISASRPVIQRCFELLLSHSTRWIGIYLKIYCSNFICFLNHRQSPIRRYVMTV